MLKIRFNAFWLLELMVTASCSDKHSDLNEAKLTYNISNAQDSIIEKNDDSASDIVNGSDEKYAVSIYDTPVLNSHEFEQIYGGIR